MFEEFSRTAMLIGSDALDRLRACKVAVFGIGGVGSYTAEALVRVGIGRLVLVDHDVVCITNINRQVHATHSTIGKPKVDAMKDRILDINPCCEVEAHRRRFQSEYADELIKPDYDYIVDAVDDVPAKVEIAVNALRLGIPVISCMGTGNRLDPTAFEIADIYSTKVCPLAKAMRRELRHKGIDSLKVVYSKEAPLVPFPCGIATGGNNDPGRNIVASISFVSSAAGLVMAGEVVRDLIRDSTGVR